MDKLFESLSKLGNSLVYKEPAYYAFYEGENRLLIVEEKGGEAFPFIFNDKYDFNITYRELEVIPTEKFRYTFKGIFYIVGNRKKINANLIIEIFKARSIDGLVVSSYELDSFKILSNYMKYKTEDHDLNAIAINFTIPLKDNLCC